MWEVIVAVLAVAFAYKAGKVNGNYEGLIAGRVEGAINARFYLHQKKMLDTFRAAGIQVADDERPWSDQLPADECSPVAVPVEVESADEQARRLN